MFQETYNNHTIKRRKMRRRRQRIRQIRRRLLCTAAVLALGAGTIVLGEAAFLEDQKPQEKQGEFSKVQEKYTGAPVREMEEKPSKTIYGLQEIPGGYPQELLELLEKNEETWEFINNYIDREKYRNSVINLEEELESGEVPLLLQWDMRWGYDWYGEEMIAISGCGPTCMSMAYLYLTGDTSMNPRKMADFASEHGYHTKVGTSWDFFTEGASLLGLKGQELKLGETIIKSALDKGGVVICSMRPGDFTTTGHFILIRGYDENGFFVNDPNSRKNSEKQWDFETLKYQIKCLWAVSGTGSVGYL